MINPVGAPGLITVPTVSRNGMSLNPKKMSPAEIRRDKKGAGGE